MPILGLKYAYINPISSMLLFTNLCSNMFVVDRFIGRFCNILNPQIGPVSNVSYNIFALNS